MTQGILPQSRIVQTPRTTYRPTADRQTDHFLCSGRRSLTFETVMHACPAQPV